MSDWQHLEDRRPAARKRHKCLLCELPIEVGEVHVVRSGMQGGDFESFRMHSRCESITRSWDADDWLYSEFGAEFRETYLRKEPSHATA